MPLTVNDLRFGHAHLEIDEAVALDRVAEPHELFREMLQRVHRHQRSRLARRVAGPDRLRRHVVLPLQGHQPGAVEFIPESDAVVAQALFVAGEAYRKMGTR